MSDWTYWGGFTVFSTEAPTAGGGDWVYWGGFTVFSTGIAAVTPPDVSITLTPPGGLFNPSDLLFWKYKTPVGNRIKLPMDWHW